jgi:hypothetical protein
MPDLGNVFKDLIEVSKGNIDALSRATNEFARAVTTETTGTQLDMSSTAQALPQKAG